MSPTVKDTSEVRNVIYHFPPDAASAFGPLSGFVVNEAQTSDESGMFYGGLIKTNKRPNLGT